ncbi:hypothetical protein Bca101_020177 [Brassica carinata]
MEQSTADLRFGNWESYQPDDLVCGFNSFLLYYRDLEILVFLSQDLFVNVSGIWFIGNWIEKSGGKKVEMAKPGLRITVPKFDNSELIVSYSRTLIGRCMNPPKQDMKILLFMLPRIWNVEGRVAGVDLGLGRFQFNFDLEEDIVEVVKNEPFFFDHWMLSLVRWKPVPEPNYPSRIIFWVRVLDIPLQFRAAPIFQCVGEALGQIRGPIDLVGGRVRVEIDAFKPLIFSVAFEFEGGVEILATLRYEKLFGFCKECFRLTHDISRCPNLHKEDPVQLKGESMETQGGSATSYKAAVASDSRQFEVSRDGQQGRYQGPRGGDKGKGVTRNKHVPYKNEDSYHPYKDRFSKGNGKGSLSHGRYGSYGERKKGLQTRGTQQPRVDNGERDPIIPEKLMLDAFKGVLRSPVKETALVQPSSVAPLELASAAEMEVVGEQTSLEVQGESREKPKGREDALHSKELDEANLMIEGVLLSDSELLLEDCEEGEDWEQGEIMDFTEEQDANLDALGLGANKDALPTVKADGEVSVEVDGLVEGEGAKPKKKKNGQNGTEALGGAKKRGVQVFISPRKNLMVKAGAKQGDKGTKKAPPKQ